MKKKFLSFMFVICFIFPCLFMFSACEKESPTKPTETSSTVYTVTETEWRTNLNLTKVHTQPQAQSVSCASLCQSAQPLTGITSYTVTAEGENEDDVGTATLKVAPNAMSIEFYKNGVFEDESGIYLSNETLYQTLTQNIMAYFPFAEDYDDFTFDQTKNAYVAQNLTSMMVADYNPDEPIPIHTKSAEVTFINGYLNTITVELCTDNTYTNVYASYVFTFSNINNTTVNV